MPNYLSWFLILAGVGIINTIYLSWHSLTGRPVKCVFFRAEWCRKVQYSKYSRTFGVPNSFAGLAIYLAIFILALTFSVGLTPFAPIAWLVAIGAAFSLYFLAIQAFVLEAFCTWCVLSAVDFALMVLILLFAR